MNSRTQEFMEKLLLFHPEMISAHFLWGNVFLREDLLTDVRKLNFKFFESALYLKSGSMPLSSQKVQSTSNPHVHGHEKSQ